MTLIIAKAQGAVDWFNGVPLGAPHGKAYSIHNHHIFPQAQLYKHVFDSDNHIHRKIVNEIANRVVLTADTNMGISDILPEIYLPKVQEHYPDALKNQFIPMNAELWKLDRYENFLESRRQMIALKINEFMAALITEPEATQEKSIQELIGLGESATLEFKSTIQWDVVQGKVNKDLHKQILKTIAAFLNSSGGTLLIGVEDDGNIYGLKEDIAYANNSTDRYLNLLSTLMSDYIGPEFSQNVVFQILPIDGQLVCRVDVEPSSIPAYLRGDHGSEFWTRVGTTSRMLDSEDTVNYINMNWN